MNDDSSGDAFAQEAHQVAYIFDPQQDTQRPHKRRRVGRAPKKGGEQPDEVPLFVPLLNGAEEERFVRRRWGRFKEAWGVVDGRIETIMKESNSATLENVSRFVASSKTDCMDQIPSAFIITGPNIASQDLLFEQLSDSLQQGFTSKFVRLKSSEATTLKAALKKIIRDATASVGDADEADVQAERTLDGRRYLDYDLEALEDHLRSLPCEHVFVAFQDSEGFESSLLSDLIILLHSWRPRIPFTLLFGIATSVDLFQARLLKAACRLVHGGQFDSVQTASILETVFKGAVAAADVPLRLGAPLLRSMLERQDEQVAGIQSFISSLKYAYMCHFYANPLSILCSSSTTDMEPLQQEHLEAVRNLPSFRQTVERNVEKCTQSSLQHAKSLIEDDDYLREQVTSGHTRRHAWGDFLLRSLLISQAAGVQNGSFSRAYVEGMARGPHSSPDPDGDDAAALTQAIRRMDSDALCTLLRRIIHILQVGDSPLRLGAATAEKDVSLLTALRSALGKLESLTAAADEAGIALRSKYSSLAKITRTTVIAQKVQLSRDAAALRDEDRQLTDVMDECTSLLVARYYASEEDPVLLSECWLYEAKSPAREVFVPRPRLAFERGLARPHEYLGCVCCTPGGSGGDEGARTTTTRATLPATSLLYRLYLETGSLINVADWWSAFHALVGDGGEEGGDDEREALFLFYRGVAELRAMGYIKGSRKKVDCVAKLKWL